MFSKHKDLIEAITNTIIGGCLGYFASLLIYPLFGIYTSNTTVFSISFALAFVSFLRNYIIRRIFDKFK